MNTSWEKTSSSFSRLDSIGSIFSSKSKWVIHHFQKTITYYTSFLPSNFPMLLTKVTASLFGEFKLNLCFWLISKNKAIRTDFTQENIIDFLVLTHVGFYTATLIYCLNWGWGLLLSFIIICKPKPVISKGTSIRSISKSWKKSKSRILIAMDYINLFGRRLGTHGQGSSMPSIQVTLYVGHHLVALSDEEHW